MGACAGKLFSPPRPEYASTRPPTSARKSFCFILRILLAASLAAVAGCARSGPAAGGSDPLDQAWTHYTLGEFEQAVRAFEEVRDDPAAGPDRKRAALFGLATTWNLRLPVSDQDKALAAGLYRRVVDEDPAGELAPWGRLALARLKHLVPVGEEPDYPALRAAYQEVIDRHSGHLAAQEAFLYQQSILAASLDPQEAEQCLRALRGFLDKNPASPFRSAIWSLITVCCATLDLPEERLQAEISALETEEVDPTNPFQERAGHYWSIATVAEFEAGDLDTARRYYRRLLEEYPTDQKVYTVKQALERMDKLEARLRAEAAPAGGPT